MEHFISKKQSVMLKGLAIIFMLMHHFFTFPEWREQYVTYGKLEAFFLATREPFRLCVPIFAILTGYIYGIGKELRIKDVLSKIVKFLQSYWLIYIILVIVSVVVCGAKVDMYYFVTGLFGLTAKWACFCWYVYFYIFMMIMMPWIVKLLRRSYIYFFVMMVMCRVVVEIFLKKMFFADLWTAMFNCAYYFPCVIIGTAIGCYNVFGKMKKITAFSGKTIMSKMILCILWCVAFWGPFLLGVDIKMFSIVGIYAAVLIYCTIVLNSRNYGKIFEFLGKHATNIWFLHCIFFAGATEKVFKKILYLPHYPLLVLLWGGLICVLASVVIIRIKGETDKCLKKLGGKCREK
ncbi:MAG: acyltransferase [Lachnospiraceae bacterium]|nr:acyltransferase [Lachnospiraceae bacterium]